MSNSNSYLTRSFSIPGLFLPPYPTFTPNFHSFITQLTLTYQRCTLPPRLRLPPLTALAPPIFTSRPTPPRSKPSSSNTSRTPFVTVVRFRRSPSLALGCVDLELGLNSPERVSSYFFSSFCPFPPALTLSLSLTFLDSGRTRCARSTTTPSRNPNF